jgi:hypothetical protein
MSSSENDFVLYTDHADRPDAHEENPRQSCADMSEDAGEAWKRSALILFAR